MSQNISFFFYIHYWRCFLKTQGRKSFTLLNTDLKSKVNALKKLNVGMKKLYLTVDLLEWIAKKEAWLDIEMYLELYLENDYNF